MTKGWEMVTEVVGRVWVPRGEIRRQLRMVTSWLIGDWGGRRSGDWWLEKGEEQNWRLSVMTR